jgi:uridine kinase
MKRPTVIAITGGSGSGKTSLLQSIRAEFSEEDLCVISQDNYYKERSAQTEDPWGYLNFDLPEAIDLDAFESDLTRLLSGDAVISRAYSFNHETPSGEQKQFGPAPVIIIEGLFPCVRPSIESMIDYSIYIHAIDNLKLIRRIERDLKERNYALKEILHRYQHHVMPSYLQHIIQWREQADLVINNNTSFDKGLQIILTFVRSLVSEYKKSADH